MVQEISINAVADVATGKKHYVSPKMGAVEMNNQGAILVGSATGNARWGNRLDDSEDYED